MNPVVVIGYWVSARAVKAAARRRNRMEQRFNQAVNHPVRQRSFLLRMVVCVQATLILAVFGIGNLLAKADVPGRPFISQQCPTGGQSFDTQQIAWLERAAASTRQADWPPKWAQEPWKIPGWLWRSKDRKLGDYSPLPTSVYGSAMLVFTVEAYVVKALMPAIPGGKSGGLSLDDLRGAARLGKGTPPGPVTGSGIALARSAAAAAGFAGVDLAIAVAVAGAESGYRPDATNRNTNGTTDHGLWQINSVHADLLASGDWRDPAANARMARVVWQRAGGSWSPWTTFDSGAYRKHMPDGGTPPTVRTAAVTPVAGCDQGATIVPASASGVTFPASGVAAERGLQPNALRVLRGVNATFGHHTYHGFGQRPNVTDHDDGNAVDVMVASYQTAAGQAHGDRIATWLQTNAGVLNVKYLIWRKRVWHPGASADAWQTMGDRGSDTANHFDHVHISVEG